MKTSNLLLLVTALLLLVASVLHALKLNGMAERGEYTLYSEVKREPGQLINIQPFRQIQFHNANNVSIEIVQSDRASLEKDEDLDVKISQRGDTLIIEQTRQSLDFGKPARLIRIQTAQLSKADITGVRLSDTTGSESGMEIQTHTLPFEIRISGFSGDRMDLNCAEGGQINLTENDFQHSLFQVGSGAVLNIGKDNRLDTLSLITQKGGSINLQGASVKRLISNIHAESWLTLSGMEIK